MDDEDTDPINAAVWAFIVGLIAVILIIYPFLKRKGDKGAGWLFNFDWMLLDELFVCFVLKVTSGSYNQLRPWVVFHLV